MTIFNGQVGNDLFSGTAGDDVFNYGNVTLSGSTVTAGRGLDTITSGGGTDRLTFANLGIDHINGVRDGSDFYLYIQPTTDWTDATAVTTLGGVKIANMFAAADGSGLIDRVDFSDGYATTSYNGSVFRVLVYNPTGVLQHTNVDGWTGNDSLVGSGIGDYIGGEAGNDTLVGQAGDDELNGGDGTDLLNGGAGNDTLDGGAGADTATYVSANGGVKVDLTGGTATQLGATNVGTDTLFAIERVIGGNFADQLIGNGSANVLTGGAGDDTLIGGAGNDSLVGGAGADYFDGSASGTVLAGRGNDTIDGGAVLDRVNYIDANTLSYENSGGAVIVNLQTGVASDGAGGTDTLSNIDFVRGSAYNDSITGSSGGGFEQFWGNNGDDTINGGAITDTLNGTDSNRVAYDRVNAAVTVDLAAGTATGQGSDVLININQVRGSNLGDHLYGSDRSDVTEQFEGRGGNDTIDGHGGTDLVRYVYAANGVSVNLATGVGFVAAGDQDTLANIEGVRGSAFNDTLTGGNTANNALEFFRGMGGNDTIDGGAGYDRVDYVDSVQAVVVTLGGAGAGTAQDGQAVLNGQIVAAGTPGATTGVDTLLNIEAVRGSDFNDTLSGSDIATQETFEGRKGADLIDGHGGLDRASYFTSVAGVTATLGLSGADGSAADGWGTTDTLRNIENLQGSRDFADRLTGNELANLLDGLGGNDTLAGGSGNDTLQGGDGNDLLIGGAGNDVLTGGAGQDLFRFVSAPNANSNADRIGDFVAADDTLQLDDAYFVGIGATGTLAAGAFHAGTAATEADDRVIYDSATGKLYFDADGSGAGAQVLFATVTAGTALSAADFVII